MRKFQNILLLFLIVFSINQSFLYSSSKNLFRNEKRIPDKEEIEKFRKDKDFDYTTAPENPNTISKWIAHWVRKILDTIFSNNGPFPFIRWAIIVGLLVLLILKILKVKPQALVYKNKFEIVNAEEIKIDLHKINIEEQIENAVNAKNYRLAVRLLYLQLLKKLHSENLIKWAANKTNYDYFFEMRETKYSEMFFKLSRIYEYVWYGQFEVEEPLFLQTKNTFQKFYSELNERK